jgi:hypothetical protein
LTETCKGNGVDAYHYLTELFKALPNARSANDYEALLPWKLSQRKENTAAQLASACKGVVDRPLTPGCAASRQRCSLIQKH